MHESGWCGRKAVDEELCDLKDTGQCLLEDCKSLLESADKLAKKYKIALLLSLIFITKQLCKNFLLYILKIKSSYH